MRPRFSHWTFTIGGGREPSLRREAITVATLDVCVLSVFGVLDVQRARAGGLTFSAWATQGMLMLNFVYTQVPLWWRVYMKLWCGEDVGPWAMLPMPPRMLRWWLTVPVLMFGGYILLAGVELLKGLQAGLPDWLGIGIITVALWFLRGLALAPVVGLPGQDAPAAAEHAEDSGGRSEADFTEPDGV